MIKYDKRCKVCDVITREGADSPLLKRIYDSRNFVPDGEPLTAIADDYKADIKYLSLYNHTKKHQTLTEDEIAEKVIDKTEKKLQADRAARLYSTAEIRDKIKDMSMEKLENGEVKGFTVSAIGKILKDEDDVKAKQKDQQIKILGMIEGFQSGELKFPGAIDGEVLEPADFTKLEA